MQIKIHREGKNYFIASLILSLFFLFLFPFMGLILFVLSLYIFYFFRDPIRSIPEEDVIVSPADGIITFVDFMLPPKELEIKEEYIKVSIFLNIFNVHVNRMPTNGIIKKIKYIKGKFINATLDKSSLHNERNIILIEKKNNDFLIVTQIAGLIARRIISDIKEKQEIKKGYRFGIIKFGSRVDLYMPKNYKPLVAVGQVVVAGETIIANPNKIEKISNSFRN